MAEQSLAKRKAPQIESHHQWPLGRMVQHASTSGSPYSIQRPVHNALGRNFKSKGKKPDDEGTASSSAAPEPPSPFIRFPWEIVYHILQVAALDQSNAGPLLALSSHHAGQLKQHVYHNISLTSLPAIESFAALLRKKPELGRLVRNLWIGPATMESDLLSALAPPECNESPTTLDARHRANAFTRAILRACRKTKHLALSGGLCSPASTYGYGTACQPRELTCVNPHSFVGGFGAPMFAMTEHIHLIDVSLTTDETDHLVRLPKLRVLTWTSPRDDGDATGDARKITDLAWQCAGNEDRAPLDALSQSPSYDFNRDAGTAEDLLGQSRIQVRTGPSSLERVHVILSSTRREMLRRALNTVEFVRLDDTDPSKPKQEYKTLLPTPPDSHADEPPYAALEYEIDASSSMTPLLAGAVTPPPLSPMWRPRTPPPDTESDLLDAMDKLDLAPKVTVQTSTLPHSTVEEWQALRDEILSPQYRWDGYRPPKKKRPHPAYPGEESPEYTTIEDSFADGSEALEYFHRQWLFCVAKNVPIRR